MVNDHLSSIYEQAITKNDSALSLIELAEVVPANKENKDTKESPDLVTKIKQIGSDFAGSISAGIAGSVAWSIIPGSRFGTSGKFIATGIAGALSKTTVKGSLELLTLNSADRTLSSTDLLWGAVDAYAGLTGIAADKQVAHMLTSHLGFKYAGSQLSKAKSLEIGEKVLASSLSERMKSHALRGLSAGSAASFVWATPHTLIENKEDLNSLNGWQKATKEIGINTLIGASLGLGISSFVSTIANRKEISELIKSNLQGDKGITRFDILHFNDVHSSLLGEHSTLSRIATKASELRKQSEAKGRTALLFDAGDNYSGNVVSASTNVGYVEARAVQMMKPDAVVPGNHVADIGHGSVDIFAWQANIQKLEQEFGKNVPGLAANLEIPSLPGFIGKNGSFKPYRIVEVNNNGQKEKVGLVGLVTEELESAANSSIIYRDAKLKANEAIQELNGQGINKVVIVSHLGRSEDIALARDVKGISAIVGAHSHDIEPLPFWIKNKDTGIAVPITQAGSKAGWLGELNLALKADGSAARFKTNGRLHEMHSGIKPEPEIDKFIQDSVGKVAKLKDTKYPATIAEEFSADNIRGQLGIQTPLGSIIARALLEGTKNHLTDLNNYRTVQRLEPFRIPQAVLKNSGDIRAGLAKGNIDHYQLSNVFINTGSKERELKEMAMVQMTGSQLKNALEFSVRDLPHSDFPRTPKKLIDQLLERSKALFTDPPEKVSIDYSGDFMQLDGLRYSFDRSLAPGKRVLAAEIRDPQTGSFLPIESTKKYDLVTSFHSVDKWGNLPLYETSVRSPNYLNQNNWVLGNKLNNADARRVINAQSIQLSQVELLAEYLVRNKISHPKDYASKLVIDDSPKGWTPSLKPSTTPIMTPAILPSVKDDLLK